MSLQRALLALGATMALFGSAADASAQFYDRQRLERQRIQQSAARTAMPARPVMQARPVVQSRPALAPTTAAQPARPNAVLPKPAAVAVRQPVEALVKAAPPPPPALPLTEEQLAAKAAVDEILAREPALAAAKERPDPKLSNAAKARHDAHEQKLAALKVKEEAEAARRKHLEDKNKTRNDAKNTVQKSGPEPQSKNSAASQKTAKPEREAKRTAVATMTPATAPALAAAPAQPLLRMPAP